MLANGKRNKKNLTIFFAFCILLIVIIPSCSPFTDKVFSPKAQKGILDLRQWDFSEDEIIRLDGKWKFYWNKWKNPDRVITVQEVSEDPSSFIDVPSSWNNHLIDGQPVGGKGFATYEILILLPENIGTCSIHIPEIATAYRLYINGINKGSIGSPGKVSQKSIPKIKSTIIDFAPKNGKAMLSFQVSNYHHRLGGIWETVYFGTQLTVHKSRIDKVVLSLLFFVTISLVGLYHLGLFIARKKERTYLYFGLFCLFISLRIIIVEERLLVDFIPVLPVFILFKLEYLTFHFIVGSIATYLYFLFPLDFNKTLNSIIQSIILCFSIIVLVFPIFYFTHTLTAFQIFTFVLIFYSLIILAQAFKNKRVGIKTFLLGFLIFIATAINDVLYAMEILSTQYIIQFGMFFFITCQAIILLRKYTLAFEIIENQKTDLSLKNRLLDSELIKRKETQKALRVAAKNEKYALVGQVAGKIAHDFNNILGAIMGNTELALMKYRDGEIEKTLDIILEQTKRGKILTGNLVAFARNQEPKQEYFDINEKLNLVLALIKSDRQGVRIEKEFQKDLPRLLADPGMIEQALFNIIQNSIHAMSKAAEPCLKLKTYLDTGQLIMEISDNGCGIPKKYQKDIYTPSFTLKGGKDMVKAYKEGIKGTGYGMANVKKSIDKHNGDIHFDSFSGSGTTFIISIPLTEKQLTQKQKAHLPRQHVVQKKRILLVEDAACISTIQAAILTAEPFFHIVEIAPDAESAIELYNKQPFDMVSLDYILSGKLNGMDVYKYIRQKDLNIPILFISGNIEFLESIKELTSSDKFLSHLSKPCENIKYAETINSLACIKLK